MLWESVVGGLLGKVAPKVAEYYQQKQQQKHDIEMEKLRGKLEWEKAKTQRAEASEGRDHEWELQAQRMSGWKDEYVLIVLSLPTIGCFIPVESVRLGVLEGFNVLGMTPQWYQWLITMIYAAVFGIRLWRRPTSKGD